MNTPLTQTHDKPSPTQHTSPRKPLPPTLHIRIPTLLTPTHTVRQPHPRHTIIRTPIDLHITTSLLQRTEIYRQCKSSPNKLSHATTPTPLRDSTTPLPRNALTPFTQSTQEAIAPTTLPHNASPTTLPIYAIRLPYNSHLPSMPPNNHNTRFATWNLNKYSAYSGPLHACSLSSIDTLHCPEPSTRFTTLGSNLPHRLTQNAHQAGYHPFFTHHSLVYLKSDTVYPHLLTHTAAYNGRVQTFFFAGSYDTHTIFLAIYAYQRGYIQPSQYPNTPISLRNEIDKTLRHLYIQYPHTKTIVLGDLQHTINNSHHQRMGPIQPPPR